MRLEAGQHRVEWNGRDQRGLTTRALILPARPQRASGIVRSQKDDVWRFVICFGNSLGSALVPRRARLTPDSLYFYHCSASHPLILRHRPMGELSRSGSTQRPAIQFIPSHTIESLPPRHKRFDPATTWVGWHIRKSDCTLAVKSVFPNLALDSPFVHPVSSDRIRLSPSLAAGGVPVSGFALNQEQIVGPSC